MHRSPSRDVSIGPRGNSGHFNFRSTVTKNGQTLGKFLAMYIQGTQPAYNSLEARIKRMLLSCCNVEVARITPYCTVARITPPYLSHPGILRSPSRDASMIISRSPSRDAMITIPGCIDRHPGMYRSPSRDASIAIPGFIDHHPGMHRSPSRDAAIAIPRSHPGIKNDSHPGILRSPSRDASMVISRSPSRDAMITIPGCIDRHPGMYRSPSRDVSIAIPGCIDRHPGMLSQEDNPGCIDSHPGMHRSSSRDLHPGMQ